MKKRQMKKHIPYGDYCYNCKWRKFKGRRFVTGIYQDEPYEEHIPIFQCLYLNITDRDMETLLWDGIKECGEHIEESVI